MMILKLGLDSVVLVHHRFLLQSTLQNRTVRFSAACSEGGVIFCYSSMSSITKVPKNKHGNLPPLHPSKSEFVQQKPYHLMKIKSKAMSLVQKS